MPSCKLEFGSKKKQAVCDKRKTLRSVISLPAPPCSSAKGPADQAPVGRCRDLCRGQWVGRRGGSVGKGVGPTHCPRRRQGDSSVIKVESLKLK